MRRGQRTDFFGQRRRACKAYIYFEFLLVTIKFPYMHAEAVQKFETLSQKLLFII